MAKDHDKHFSITYQQFPTTFLSQMAKKSCGKYIFFDTKWHYISRNIRTQAPSSLQENISSCAEGHSKSKVKWRTEVWVFRICSKERKNWLRWGHHKRSFFRRSIENLFYTIQRTFQRSNLFCVRCRTFCPDGLALQKHYQSSCFQPRRFLLCWTIAYSVKGKVRLPVMWLLANDTASCYG